MAKNFKLLKEEYQQTRSLTAMVAIIDGQKASSLNDFFNQMARQLKFPSYFGRNLDALYDCLCDFSWIEVRDVHVVLRDYDQFLSKEQAIKRWDVLNVLNDAANEWRAIKGAEKIRFEIYVEPSERIKQDLDDAEV